MGQPLFVPMLDEVIHTMHLLVRSRQATLDASDAIHVEDALLEHVLKSLLDGPYEDGVGIFTHLYRCAVLAIGLEALRMKLFWGDLPPEQRMLLEPASRKSMEEDPVASKEKTLFPQDDRPTPLFTRFIVWWSRHDGKPPAWADRAFMASRWGVLREFPVPA